MATATVPRSAAKQGASDFTTITGRRALAPRNDPYWLPVATVQHAALGFRKTGAIGELHGTWVARLRVLNDDGTTRYAFEALGVHADHHAATKAALAWFELRSKGIVDTVITVKKVCHDYADAMERTRLHGKAPRPDSAAVFRLQLANWVDNDPIGAIPLVKLTKANVRAWRLRLEAAPDKMGKQRTAMSINRETNALRSPLNWAREELELVPDDSAWRTVLKRIAGAAPARSLYLTVEEREALLQALDAEARPLMRSLLLVPLRPGIAAKLKAGWFDKKLGTLMVGERASADRADRDKTDKATGRQLVLPKETAAFFAQHTTNKHPNARIFTRADGTPWTARQWGRAVEAARKKAFPKGTKAHSKTSAYTLRHCSITDLARAGVPLTLVADLAGTSVAEIEKHYRQYVATDSKLGLAVLAAGMRV